jgi:hypothetical protein
MSYLSTALIFRVVVAFFTVAGAAASHWHWSGWVAGFFVGLVFASVLAGTRPDLAGGYALPAGPRRNRRTRAYFRTGEF